MIIDRTQHHSDKGFSHKARGFTILELIIVVIIVGVLASLALPKMTLMIERVRITEGVGMLTQMRSYMERCYLMNNQSYSACSNAATVADLTAVTQVPNSHFQLGSIEIIAVSAPPRQGYLIEVLRNAHELAVNDPGGLLGCFVVSPHAQSGIVMCNNFVSGESDIYLKGSGLYTGYSTKLP